MTGLREQTGGRITVLIHTVSLGGVKRHIEDIVTRMDKQRFEIVGAFPRELLNTSFMTDADDDYSTIFTRAGLQCHVVETPFTLSPIKALTASWTLFRLLRDLRPDVFHAHSSMAGIVGRLAMFLWRPALCVYTPHLPFFALKTGLKRLVSRFIEKTLFRGYDRIIAVSRSECDDLAGLFGEGNLVQHINQAVPGDLLDEVRMDIDGLREELGIPEGAAIILSTARFARQKDVPTLVEAAALLRRTHSNFVILLAGEGEQRALLENIVREKRLERNVRFLGWRNDIRRLISLSDVMVLSTQREGLPYALLEAMALKKPVIGSDVPGVRECILDERTGFLFPRGDAHAFAERLRSLLDDRERCREMGENGRAYCLEEFSTSGMVAALENLYATSVEKSA